MMPSPRWTPLLFALALGPCQVAHEHNHPATSASAAAPPPSASPIARPGVAPSARAPAPSAPAPNAHASHDPAPDPHAGHSPQADVKGYAHVPLEALALDQLGLATAKVERRPLVRKVRTSGWVTVDETRTSHVHAKVRGYVVSSHKSFVGQTVKRGDPLVSLYSESVLAAELDLLALLDQSDSAEAAVPGSVVSKSLDSVVDASRRRFRLWDIPEAQVAKLERSRKPSRGLTLSAPRDGVILARAAIDGAYVEPATELFVISDVSQLWVVFDVFERDMPYVKLGQHVTLACEGMLAPHDAEISFLAPTIDPATRSLRARVSVDSQGGALRPGAFSTVTLDLPLGDGLAIPTDAVIRTGLRDLAFVVKDGMLVPTEITLGPEASGYYRVDGGLLEGDTVSTGAEFLIDAESQLRGAGTTGGHQHGG